MDPLVCPALVLLSMLKTVTDPKCRVLMQTDAWLKDTSYKTQQKTHICHCNKSQNPNKTPFQHISILIGLQSVFIPNGLIVDPRNLDVMK